MPKWKMQTAENEALTQLAKTSRMNAFLILLGIGTLVAAAFLLRSPEDDQ